MVPYESPIFFLDLYWSAGFCLINQKPNSHEFELRQFLSNEILGVGRIHSIFTECLELNRQLGDPRGIANALIESGQNQLRLGVALQGERNIREGVKLLRQLGDWGGIVQGYFELGRYYYWTGDCGRSIQLVEKSRQIFEDLGMLDQFVFASIGIGLGLSHLGRYTETIIKVVRNLQLKQELDAR